MDHISLSALEAGMADIRRSPTTDGPIELIVCRPAVLERTVLDEAELDTVEGLVGDCWRARGSRLTDDGGPHPGMQLTLMNTRVAAAVAGERDRWPLAGDQIYVDLDLSERNLPAGTRLSVGTAIIEVTGEPHTGCQKFKERFGGDALRFVNTGAARELRLRGMNTRVVHAGRVRVGDKVSTRTRTRR